MNDASEIRGLSRDASLIRKAALYTLGAGGIVVLALAIWTTHQALLLVFAGILLAVLLHGMSSWVEHWTHLPRLITLPSIVIILAGAFVLTLTQAGPTLEEQGQQLLNSLRAIVGRVTQQLRDVASEEQALSQLNFQEILNLLPSPWGVASGATAAVLTVLGVISSAFIILFVGVYLAADPRTYMKLAVRLAPAGHAADLRDLLIETGSALRGWLLGQLCSMAAIGTMVYVGLLFLGMPLAFVLALFAALMGFIPYLGPILGAIPMLAVAGGQGWEQFLYVFALYVTVQAVESNLLTPLIQSRAVHMPPAIVIASQLVMGALFGILGLALATPLVAAASVPLAHYYPKRNVVADEQVV